MRTDNLGIKIIEKGLKKIKQLNENLDSGQEDFDLVHFPKKSKNESLNQQKGWLKLKSGNNPLFEMDVKLSFGNPLFELDDGAPHDFDNTSQIWDSCVVCNYEGKLVDLPIGSPKIIDDFIQWIIMDWIIMV